MKNPDFAKQNDCDSAARPLTDIPTKLLKEGFNVPPRLVTASSRHGTTFQYHLQGAVRRLNEYG